MKKILFPLFCIFSVLCSMAQEKVYMTYEKSGIYTIPCEVNGLKLRFVFDTGAADVSLSLIEAAFMLKNGYIDNDDFIGTDTYSLADGSLSDNMIVNLKSIKIGPKTLSNVKACISSQIKASLLLGQSAIMKLGKYTVEGNVLTLYPSVSSQSTFSAKTNPTLYKDQSELSNDKSKEYPFGTYKGGLVNGKREGFGRIEYVSGDNYVGNWKNDQFDGLGTYVWKNGDKYTGSFKKGFREGYGTYIWISGDRYSGNWSMNEQNGTGTFYYANGDVKSGTWKKRKCISTSLNFSGTSNGKVTSGNSSYSNSSSKKDEESSDDFSDSYTSSTYSFKHKYYYTAYTTTSLNLREGPNVKYDVITKIPEGKWVFMDAEERNNSFTKVMYIETGEEGYVSSKYLDGYTKVTVNDKGSLEVTGKTDSKYAEINLRNDANVTAKITIGNHIYTLASNSSKKIKYIEGGRYNIMATAPGIIPYVGEDTIEGGYEYSWRFYVTTVKK